MKKQVKNGRCGTLYEVTEVCQRVLFLSRGKVLLQGEPHRLIAEHGAATLEDLFIEVAHEHPVTGEIA